MQTLSNNVKKPEDGDAGNVWSDGLETNAEILNTLITTVDTLTISDITKPDKELFNANWVVAAEGTGYKQNVSMPVGASLDTVGMRFRVTNGPKINRFINPTILPTSLTTFDIIVNDSTIDIDILFV
jgi:hypothetical protein